MRQKPDKANRTPKGCRKGNPSAETCRNKTANQNRPARKSRMRRCRRTFSLCGNPPARSPSPHVARHRQRRKGNHNPLPMLQNWRRPPSGNPARSQRAFDIVFARIGKGKNLPLRLVAALAQNPRQFWLSRVLDSGRSAPHLRKFPRKTLRRLAASSD